jgi:hypothetical protein
MNRLHKAILLFAAAGVVGCSQGKIENPSTTLPEKGSSAAALHRISNQKIVNQNDAMHALLLLAEGEDQAGTFQERVMKLRDLEIIDPSWNVDATKPVTRGQLAYMVYQVTDVPGGLTLLLTGPSQRYCLRELQYNGMIGPGGLFSPITGMEMVAVLDRADAYMQDGQMPDVLNPRGE